MPTRETALHPRLVPLALVALSVGLLAGCAPEPAAPPGVPSVFVSPVRNDTGAAQRLLFGSVRPRVEAELSFRASGMVTARLVELGQAVRAGQVLAHIDPADYERAAQAATAQERTAEVDAAQAVRDAARFKRLLADGSVGAADAERQQARADAAAARLAQAQQQSALARNRARYTELKAPFDGVVTALRFETGQTVHENHSVLSLARPGELEVVVDVPEALVGQLSAWQASLLLAAGSAAPETAATSAIPLRLRELAPSASATTGTTRARYATAPGAKAAGLRMGMTATVHLQQAGRVSGAELPVGALLATAATTPSPSRPTPELDTGPAVWRVDAQTGALKRQPVRLLSQSTDHVRVAGLTDGDLVVTVGAHTLDAGLKVQPVQRPLAAVSSAVLAR